MPLSPEEYHVLVEKIDESNHEMARLSARLATADKRARWARSVAIVGVIAGIMGGAVGAGGVIVGASAQATADALAASRRETQQSACVQANLTNQRTRDALIAGVEVVAAPDPRRSEMEQARVDRFVVAYTASVQRALPYRDCSRRGIELYFANPPDDPALGEPPGGTTTSIPGG